MEHAPRGRRHGIAISIAVALTGGCSQDRWEGYVQPHRRDHDVYNYVGTYQTLAACRRMALTMIKFSDTPALADYECRKNCRWELTAGVFLLPVILNLISPYRTGAVLRMMSSTARST